MPSTIDTATEQAHVVPEELAFPADETPPHAGPRQGSAERVTERGPGDIPFEDGVSDAWGSGWPMRR